MIKLDGTVNNSSISAIAYDTLDFCLDKLEELALRIAVLLKDFLDSALSHIHNGIDFTLRKACAHIANKTVARLIPEDTYEGKIDALRFNLRLLTKSDHAPEASRFFANYAAAYVTQYVCQIEEIESTTRPQWVQELLEGNQALGAPLKFTLVGEALRSFLANHQKLFTETLEVNFLKASYRLQEKIDELNKANPNFLLDLLKDSCEEAEFHFEDLAAPYSQWPDEKLVDQEKVASKLLGLLFPQGADDLDIPGPDFLTTRLKDVLWELVKNQIVPKLIGVLFEAIQDQRVKDLILIEGFSFLRQFVNEEAPRDELNKESSLFSSSYTSQHEFNKAVGEAFVKFFEYIEPSLLPKVFYFIKREDIDEVIGAGLSDAIQKLSLPDVLGAGTASLLTALNDGGRWVEKSGELLFQQGPITFPKNEQQVQELEKEKDKLRKLTREQLESVLDEIGKDPKGLMQMAKDKYIGKDVEEAASQSSYLSAFTSYLRGGVSSATKKAKNGLITLSVNHMSKKIHFLGKEVFQRMDKPVHDRLYQLVAQNVVQQICV
jgi:hypothetical protein